MRRWLFLAVAAVAALLACGGGKAASELCRADTDCAQGLVCLPFAVFQPDSGICNDEERICSGHCQFDSDCAAVGTHFICLEGCTHTISSRFCGKTGR